MHLGFFENLSLMQKIRTVRKRSSINAQPVSVGSACAKVEVKFFELMDLIFFLSLDKLAKMRAPEASSSVTLSAGTLRSN